MKQYSVAELNQKVNTDPAIAVGEAEKSYDDTLQAVVAEKIALRAIFL